MTKYTFQAEIEIDADDEDDAYARLGDYLFNLDADRDGILSIFEVSETDTVNNIDDLLE